MKWQEVDEDTSTEDSDSFEAKHDNNMEDSGDTDNSSGKTVRCALCEYH